MSSNIVVEFEVLPDDAGVADQSAQQVCSELQRQLADPSSTLRSGEFGRFAASASLSGPGLPETQASPYLDGTGGGGFGGMFAAPATNPSLRDAYSEGCDPGGFGGMSGFGRDQPAEDPSRRRGSRANEALEDKCYQLQQRLEAVERELREAQETGRMHRQRYEQNELKLKDREQLLFHAKEMWMKENIRASKLADALTSAEDKIADQEKRMAEMVERYNETQSEVRALQHLIGTEPNGGGPSTNGFYEKQNGRSHIPETDFSIPGSRQFGTAATLEASDLDRSAPLDGRGIPSAGSLPRSGQMVPVDGETNADRFRRLCHINDAVLYEDDMLQIGVKAEYAGVEGQLAVFFGNKCGAALHAFSVQYFVREEKALRLTASPLSQQIEADKQVIQRINAVMQEPFAEPPAMRIQFLLPDTSPRTIQLKLPVVLTKFMVGREMASQEFFQHWRLQHFVLNEATSIVHLAARFRGTLVNVARSIVFGGGLRMHHGVDTNPDNFVLVGQHVDSSSGRQHGQGDLDLSGRPRSRGGLGIANSDQDRGLTLARVEVGSGRFMGKVRVVVRSSDPVAARAVCDGIVAQLSEANAPPSDGLVAR